VEKLQNMRFLILSTAKISRLDAWTTTDDLARCVWPVDCNCSDGVVLDR